MSKSRNKFIKQYILVKAEKHDVIVNEWKETDIYKWVAEANEFYDEIGRISNQYYEDS